jgi:hypothetical protein
MIRLRRSIRSRGQNFDECVYAVTHRRGVLLDFLAGECKAWCKELWNTLLVLDLALFL